MDWKDTKKLCPLTFRTFSIYSCYINMVCVVLLKSKPVLQGIIIAKFLWYNKMILPSSFRGIQFPKFSLFRSHGLRSQVLSSSILLPTYGPLCVPHHIFMIPPLLPIVCYGQRVLIIQVSSCIFFLQKHVDVKTEFVMFDISVGIVWYDIKFWDCYIKYSIKV